MKSLTVQKKPSSNFPSQIKKDEVVYNEGKDIANTFNKYLANRAPNLVSKLHSSSKSFKH